MVRWGEVDLTVDLPLLLGPDNVHLGHMARDSLWDACQGPSSPGDALSFLHYPSWYLLHWSTDDLLISDTIIMWQNCSYTVPYWFHSHMLALSDFLVVLKPEFFSIILYNANSMNFYLQLHILHCQWWNTELYDQQPSASWQWIQDKQPQMLNSVRSRFIHLASSPHNSPEGGHPLYRTNVGDGEPAESLPWGFQHMVSLLPGFLLACIAIKEYHRLKTHPLPGL